ncbi:MAG: arginine decarboxylase, pyruvoyl-dependent [Candidatus Lokiarchaeota archaeon]|nr:arginine decarboxylase, pyruvoyl-dependent [Candidatus Lokiarchaeota archaeon]
MIPQKIFFTKGYGHGIKKILSFENALRSAQISTYNLVKVSSILPPHCEEISLEQGKYLLRPGQIVYIVLSENTKFYNASTEPTSIFASIGVAKPRDPSFYGYLGEFSGENEDLEHVKRESRDLAYELLISSRSKDLNLDIDTYEHTAYAFVNEKDKYTTCIAAAVFVE